MKVFLRAVFVFQSRIFDDWYKSEWFNLYTVFCSEHFYFFSILCLTGWKITWKASVFKFLSGLKGVFLIWSGLEWPNGKNKALFFNLFGVVCAIPECPTPNNICTWTFLLFIIQFLMFLYSLEKQNWTKLVSCFLSFLDNDVLLPHPLGQKDQSTETSIETLLLLLLFFDVWILVLSRGTILSKAGLYDFNYLLENTENTILVVYQWRPLRLKFFHMKKKNIRTFRKDKLIH